MPNFQKLNNFFHKIKPEKVSNNRQLKQKTSNLSTKASNLGKKGKEFIGRKTGKQENIPDTSRELNEQKESERYFEEKDRLRPINPYQGSSQESLYNDDSDYRENENPTENIYQRDPPDIKEERRGSIYDYYLAEQFLGDTSSKSSLQITTSEEESYMVEEDPFDSDDSPVEDNKSVITHLLSQVKLGMDLTKVTLPTFILEKRSLLEMYADFFSHADYFADIATAPTPQERFMACVRFYLSTFSAGRNSEAAKKPYNPILGEIFRCFWSDSSLTRSESSRSKLATDGPVPWCMTDDVSFIAEQVSHHPPVSAFYAEHKNLKIQFNCDVWTKSKFLGLSIAVHNIGQGAIYVIEHGEEYVLNFPSGYCRSILSVPWIELGGDCTVTCEKTGFSAIIKFHTKPFYGGKIHKVTGEVVKPNEKKPIFTFMGTWNDVIDSKSSQGVTETLFDASRPKIIKKVKLLHSQEPYESRRLWSDVTKNLKVNKIKEATEAKQELEKKQRSEAKERIQNAIEYHPKFFHKDKNDKWVYNWQLRKRKKSK